MLGKEILLVTKHTLAISGYAQVGQGGDVIISYMQNKNEFDFDLPAVEGAAVAKPRIHFAGESTCVSCEG